MNVPKGGKMLSMAYGEIKALLKYSVLRVLIIDYQQPSLRAWEGSETNGAVNTNKPV